ncbi:HEAT repeat domain-containing protein [Niameybacter massiliensis]|uniref:HEAT repeat domain-containing protein n=1 Tax=Niameybacter massiliensis TaxID=1658108 RepID=UPI0006B4F8AC|nr:HEAT repeat domain-containing protein [Niameybacter massiliensis]
MMSIGIEVLVYIYGTICLTLVAYSIFYKVQERKVNQLTSKRTIFWEEAIKEQCRGLAKGNKCSEKHKKFLCKKLIHLNHLIAFQHALQKQQDEQIDILDDYIIEITSIFVFLGMEYSKKEDMEKAYLAYVISLFWPCHMKEHHRMMDILVSYLIETTVYCRENVLQALYRIGNIQAVENALRILNDHHYFHHSKLLADGLITFSGNQKFLAQVLWKSCKEWDDEMVIAIIQFITKCDEDFTELFWEMMNDSNVQIEIRLALIRYYKKHYYEPAGKQLCQYIEESDERNVILGIVATSALENYPGATTMKVLKKALHHSDWYIRHNAAIALIHLGITGEEIDEILKGADHYASEMLSYMLRTMALNDRERIRQVS